MQTSHFNRALLPPAKPFYEKELGRLTRPSRGWARGNCPFHESKSRISFSVNLASGGFYCFGCEAKGGDVVSFVMQRDQLTFRQACEHFGAWGNDVTPTQFRYRHREREAERQRQEEQAEAKAQERFQARHHLHLLERTYQWACDRLSKLQQGKKEQLPGELEACWATMAESLDLIRQAETRYRDRAGLDHE